MELQEILNEGAGQSKEIRGDEKIGVSPGTRTHAQEKKWRKRWEEADIHGKGFTHSENPERDF